MNSSRLTNALMNNEENCIGDFPPTAQAIIGNYLMHTMATNSVKQYLNASGTSGGFYQMNRS